ncbi:hypothetical protein [Streptomyces sp. H34-S4]|uniref:hypothetical protein n=1 Tax=Streptomyces sp. H34-S4 TaxID=2996463 RepID=UPI00226E0E28|nr:hypothetical protein [Streptomyces sp. H34-S4]MCY0938770.1 hypothetical protein [Streptomyces sp. H34-S4]
MECARTEFPGGSMTGALSDPDKETITKVTPLPRLLDTALPGREDNMGPLDAASPTAPLLSR